MVDEQKRAEDELKRQAQQGDLDAKLATVKAKAEQIIDRARNHSRLQQEWQKVKSLVDLAGDYYGGFYREVPAFTMGVVAAALLYILSPIDLIPDMIPILGQLDDIGVFLAAWALIGDAVRDYADWRAARDPDYVAIRDLLRRG